jgi:hypothetical protein
MKSLGTVTDNHGDKLFVSASEFGIHVHSAHDPELTPDQARALVVLLLDAAMYVEATPDDRERLFLPPPDTRVPVADREKPRRAPMCGFPSEAK